MKPLSFSEQLLVDTKSDNLCAVQKLIADNPTVLDTSMHSLYYSIAQNKPEFVAELIKITDVNSYYFALRSAIDHDRAEILQNMLESAPFSKLAIAKNLSHLSGRYPQKDVFKVLYSYGGQDWFYRFFDIESARAANPEYCLQIEYWASEIDALNIAQSLIAQKLPESSVSVKKKI